MPRAFAVLRHLVEHAGRLITKDELLATVWRDAIVSDAALASCIRDLRRALGDSAEAPRYIETVHRRGFRFIGPALAAGDPQRSGSEAGGQPLRAASHAALSLVGRETELAQLHAFLERARDGQRQLVFVTGEPGIGKTALVEAFLSQIDGDAGAAHRAWAMRGALRRWRSLLAAARGARTIGSCGWGRTGCADPQAACADLADPVAGAAGRPGSRGRAAPSAGGHARPDAAGAGGGPGRPEHCRRPSSCSWKTCTGATLRRSTCWRGWPAGARRRGCSSSGRTGRPMSRPVRTR